MARPRPRGQRLKETRHFLFGMTMFLTSFTVMMTVAFYLKDWLFAVIGEPDRPVFAFLATAFLGVLLLFVFGAAASLVTRSRVIAVSEELLDAIAQMAKGDFDVTVSAARRHSGPYYEFVSAINHMAEQLQRIETMRREFVSDVSHEIQSPLTSIAGFARALRDEGMTPEVRSRYLDIIEAESARLSRLGDNLLRLSALDSGRAALKPHSYRLDSQLRDTVLAAEPLWAGKRIHVDADLPHTVISGDRDLLGQVWQNLIANAVKFTPEDGTITVSLELEPSPEGGGGFAVCRVADTGIGIAKEDLPRIFERFFKADKSRGSYGGSGLGLSIVLRIAELHGGTAAAASELGRGSVFTVRLPTTQPDRTPPERRIG